MRQPAQQTCRAGCIHTVSWLTFLWFWKITNPRPLLSELQHKSLFPNSPPENLIIWTHMEIIANYFLSVNHDTRLWKIYFLTSKEGFLWFYCDTDTTSSLTTLAPNISHLSLRQYDFLQFGAAAPLPASLTWNDVGCRMLNSVTQMKTLHL